MKNINSYRKFDRNKHSVNEEGEYVLYWMQINRRFEYNFALEYAVAWANKLNKPLLIYEGLNIDYPWACDRFHSFILQGMMENLEIATQNNINLFSYVEPKINAGRGLLYNLANKACCIVSDEFPVFIVREHNTRVASKVNIPFITIDSNGLIPLGITEKDPYSAYLFRKIMQKHFFEAYTHPPKLNALSDLKNKTKIYIGDEIIQKYGSAMSLDCDIKEVISTLDIDHTVKIVDIDGSRKGAIKKLNQFIKNSLMDYDEKRNHPDEKKTSGLSPWLHYGKISEYEIVKAALEQQPKDWNLECLTPNGGKNKGFFNGDTNIEGFLDEVITWREVGFHYAHHRPDYDEFESLPNWVKITMDEHINDERKWIYSLEELEYSQTHDQIWNAAQTQLTKEGIIHNYLRMLWGKKIIEWTPDYRTALDYLIELNNKYALDGRDPNSYSGIFWCLGRFDRAWQERNVFGKLRYMASESTRKKVRLNNYIDKYGAQKPLF
jgi:deoxyribodipyrimidine photo-lyase